VDVHELPWFLERAQAPCGNPVMKQQDSVLAEAGTLAGVASEYPEKTHGLGRVFADMTNSYKPVWFLAIVSLLKQGAGDELAMKDVLTEMVVVAWYPVNLFRLSLGCQDKLQATVLEIRERSGLTANALPDAIRRFLADSPATYRLLGYLRRFVPTRFLAPWFAGELHGMEDSLRDSRIRELARMSQLSDDPSPYYLVGDADAKVIVFNRPWRTFLLENLGIVESFAEHNFALYLQSRNPNVPGVLNKLKPPSARQLMLAHEFWRQVQLDFTQSGRTMEFHDIYSGRQLEGGFSIDHFLPWSFVAHDLLWNLLPVEATTNSSKGDLLPDLDLYLPRLVKVQMGAIRSMKEHPKMLEDYTNCFKQDVACLVDMSEQDLTTKYREVMSAQVQIAENMGFQPGWIMRR
jgi:hypothetical protein